MPKDKIDPFKIGDSHRKGMSKPPENPRAKKSETEQSASVGFARIEALLEKEDPVAVGASLNHILEGLHALANESSSNKDKLTAQRAIAAVERSIDLMNYLYQTKAALQEGPAEE